MKQKRGRIYAGTAIVLLAIVALGLWQWKNVARAVVNAAAVSIAKVHLSFAEISLSTSHAVLDGVRVTSLANEPIADIGRLNVTYDLRDLLPGGKRLYGLESLTLDSPHVTIVRHADGTYNLPNPQVPTGNRAQPAPMILQAHVRGGSLEVRNESRNAPPNQRRLFAQNVTADANVSSATRSTYSVSLNYGERLDRLYPVRGRGDINFAGGYINQHWTAAQLPIAAAVNFFVDSPALRVERRNGAGRRGALLRASRSVEQASAASRRQRSAAWWPYLDSRLGRAGRRPERHLRRLRQRSAHAKANGQPRRDAGNG